MGILTTPTIRANQPTSCPLEAEEDFKNESRGCLSFRIDCNFEIMFLRWFDNMLVKLTSTFSSVGQKSTSKYVAKDFEETKFNYGGVDLVDMFISLYRLSMKDKH